MNKGKRNFDNESQHMKDYFLIKKVIKQVKIKTRKRSFLTFTNYLTACGASEQSDRRKFKGWPYPTTPQTLGGISVVGKLCVVPTLCSFSHFRSVLKVQVLILGTIALSLCELCAKGFTTRPREYSKNWC